jgi:non-homologous end joining protein Ku
VVVATTTAAPPKVVNLMDALKKSLDAVSAGKKKTAKVAVAKEPAKRKRA